MGVNTTPLMCVAHCSVLVLLAAGENCELVVGLSPRSGLCNGARLVFDVEYSPPSELLSAARPDLYAAYNRHRFSRYRRPIIAYVVDNNGNRITTGPASTMQVVAYLNFGSILKSGSMTPSETTMEAYVNSVQSGRTSRSTERLVLEYDTSGNIVQLPVLNRGPVGSLKKTFALPGELLFAPLVLIYSSSPWLA